VQVFSFNAKFLNQVGVVRLLLIFFFGDKIGVLVVVCHNLFEMVDSASRAVEAV
jgi:hypothetical protein